MNHRNLDYDKWEDEFGPLIENPFCPPHAACTTFETYGKELEYVRDLAEQNVVWTLMQDDNGETCISEGMAFVNRLAYIVTTKPYPENTTFYVADN